MLVLKVPCLALIFTLCSSQNLGLNNCASKETCGECIQEVECVWCISPLTERAEHCLHQNHSNPQWCTSDFLVNPKGRFDVLENESLSSKEGNVVQIQPQRVKLSLRKGEEHVIEFQYKQAQDYPVDLYYIMDLSASMEEHREKLAKLGEKLAETMKNITKDFRLGFGSFVDKVELPFVSTVPAKLIHPCTTKKNGKTFTCAAPYSFKNHMSLSRNYKEFSNEVSKAKVSGNLDSPEGGFDALMQAIVCKDEIGWRAKARHLVVFSTDADFHIAGDGKLAGVVEPNDAQCHMKNHSYTDYLVFDYPSISQINYIAKENNINIIFAIVNKRRILDSYRKLSEEVENSNMGALDEKSENVINLVIDNYNKIVDSVTLSHNASNDVEIKIFSNCPNGKVNGCTDIHVGEVVNFNATIKALECTKGSYSKTIYIKPEGVEESMIVELEVLCECPCESASYAEPDSPKCSNSGTLKCGVCHCDSGYFGKICECNRETAISNDISQCQKTNNSKVCSGLGICKCGQCRCNMRSNPEEKIFGKFCDCDNYSCKRVDGKLCSQRGTCECGGDCKCYAGWEGDACQCSSDKSSCVKPDNNKECNGHGTCNCGKCECFDEKVRYSGKYCDECPTCSGQRCEELRHCVECKVFGTGLYNKAECASNCTTFTPEIVEKLDAEPDETIKTCTIVDDKECRFVFQYEYLDILGESKDIRVKVEKNKFCYGPPDILPWILGVIGSILLAGLLILIIWKIYTTVHDRREYAKFENEKKNLRWHRNDNPLYKEATSTFANPVYRRSRMWSKKS